ncbi:MAG: InlB B-repeat-containing protein [Bacteroidales bacterium]|nr:InlB B-repeat-containing protein [Bacteroidales bacterium]
MRKLSLLALLVLFTLPIFAKHVDVETARNVAQTFWEQNLGKPTRATFSDVTSQTEFTTFYIFNTDGGFVIVSADDIATPILGYSDEGNFDTANIPVNLQEWLQSYEQDINLGIANGVAASDEIATKWGKLISGTPVLSKQNGSVNALIQTKWNQGFPYNALCPYDDDEDERTVTGCVATAMAQLMKYWNYPAQGNGTQTYTHSKFGELSVDFGSTTYDWDNMLNSYSNSATQAQKDAVATLMYHCGVAVHMSYDVSSHGGSGAVTVGPYNGTTEYALKNFFLYKNTLVGCYKSDYNDEDVWKNMIYTEIDASRPVIYTGRGGGTGHCFICDGYDNNDQFHFNWGWGGSCDGFFALTSLNPGSGNIGSGAGTFNESQSAIFGIEPNAGLFAIPNALSLSGIGESKTFMVRSSTASSQSWTASSNQSWLTVSPETGSGSGSNTTVTATATRNTTASERTATITITQGSATATVTVVQPSGIPNDPGCFGTDTYDTFLDLDPGNMVVICGEGFGYYTSGHQITKVKFTTLDGASTSYYTDYTNNSYTIKIFEGGNVESIGNGSTSNIAGAMGTQVYSQNYIQSDFGEQEIILNTPYTIDETKNFWVVLVANGKSLIRAYYNDYGAPISVDDFEGSSVAFDGKYLYSFTSEGTDYLTLNSGAYYTDTEHTTIQLYSLDIMLTFCTVDPSLLIVTPETLSFEATGDNKSFTVKANDNNPTGWTASSSESWLILSAYSGSGSGATTTVTATAAENISGADREATITVTQGSETRTITVTQPDGSIADINRWYGNMAPNNIFFLEPGNQVIIRPEKYGNFAAGSQVTKVRFETYNGARVQNSSDYVNNSFTIKIYENNSVNSALTVAPGYTSNINSCLGTEVYSQNYTSESFTDDDYDLTHIVELNTPYTIQEGVNFWIAVVVNGKTIFDSNNVTSGEPILSSEFTPNMAVARANGKYLYTDTYSETDYINMNYSYGTSGDYKNTYSVNFDLSFYVSDGITPYVPSSDFEAKVYGEDNYLIRSAISIGANDNIVLYATATNNGPDDATQPFGVTLNLSSETLNERTINLSESNPLRVGYRRSFSYTITAEQMNQMLATGTFDICFSIDYSGQDVNETNNTYCITVIRETPNFTISASAQPAAGGTVTGAGTYNLGAGVNLVATPVAGYNFTSWTENGTVVSTNANYQFTVNSDRTLVANFTQSTYNVTATVDPANSGTISGNNSPYTYGNNVSLTANANPGFSFVNWTDEDASIVSTNATYQFTIDGNRNLVAHFDAEHYTITATANPTQGGSVEGAGSYDYGQQVTLTATANTGYTFVKWTENSNTVSTNATYQFTATGNRGLVANFELIGYNILATANPVAGGTVSGAGNYTHGQTVSLTATANNGYNFVNWTENNTIVSTNANYSFTATSSRTLVANFQIISYSISASANPTNGGTVSGAGNYNHGQNVTLTANANTGYHFVNWTENSSVVSSNAEYTFTANANRTLVANFEINTYIISANANPIAGGTVNGAGDYTHGQTVTLSAVANTGYNFANWTENGNTVSTNATYQFTATDSRTLVANFEAITFNISASAYPTEGGTVTGSGNYAYGQNVTLTAVANTGYTFTNWTENGAVVSTDAEYSFTSNDDRTLVANFEINTYTITASASPAEYGSVSGAGTYTHGQTVTLNATANADYSFVNWTENNTIVSTNATYSFTATENRTLVANFATITYTITASANPTEGGTVNGSGNYASGQEVNLSAIANTGYDFVNWTENDAEVSTDANYSFTATENRTLVANFQITSYTISASANPVEGGTVSGNGNYNYGQNVTLTATAYTGYTFVNWTENDVEVATDANYSFTATENRNLVANFQINTYVISADANPADGGTVNGAGNYTHGQTVTLSAVANTGYNFVSWTENGSVVSTNAEYSFTATDSRTLVANFEAITYNISASANPVEGGTIDGTGDYTYGQNVTLTAVANTGYHFVNWTENGNEVSTDAEYSFTATEGRTLVANFEINTYSVTAIANPTEGGNVSIDIASQNDLYNYGTNLVITATANDGYHFVQWNDGVTTAQRTYMVDANAEFIAYFVQDEAAQYIIAVTANPTEGGSVEGAGIYQENENVVLIANANTGYTFVNWTENGNIVSTNASYSFVATANRTLVANFELNTYTISASVNPAESGTITGAGEYTHGQNVTLIASANAGYTFVNWTEDGTVVSNTASYMFAATTDRTLVANFEINTYTITVSANPTEYGTVSGGGIYTHGQSVTISAVANEGYIFVNWTENGFIVSNDAEYSFTAASSRNFVANFGATSYTITADANPTAGGTISGAGEYVPGQTVYLTATANEGYTFVNWTEDGSVVYTNPDYRFTAIANRTLVANFEINTYTILANSSPIAGGTVEGAGDYIYGQTAILTATANEGYNFVNWTENDEEVSTDANYSFIVTGNRLLYANFQNRTLTVTAVANPTEGGIVEGADEYTYGQTATLTATANENYNFINWTENDVEVSTEAEYSFTVTADRNLVANFIYNELTICTITATANPIEGGTIDGAGDYTYGEAVSLTASANTGYHFVNWTENDAVVSVNENYSFTARENRNLVANFQRDTHTVYVTTNLLECGTVEGAGEYTDGETATLIATANDNYHFVNWTESGEELSTEAEYSFVVTRDRYIVANFEYEVSIDAVELGSISVYPNPTSGMFTVGLGAIEGDVICQIVNANGSLVETREINVDQDTEIVFDCNVAPGVYFVRVISGDSVWTESIVINR